MNQSIEKIAIFFIMMITGMLVIPAAAVAQAPFYASQKSCVPDMGTPTQGGQQGGGQQNGGQQGGQQGGMMQEAGCSVPTTFFDTDTSSTGWTWNFGDGSGIVPATRKINHQYNSRGTYTATLERTTPNGLETVTKTINVGDYPNAPLFNKKPKTDTLVCGGSTLTLNPYKLKLPPSNVTYLWYPTGDTTKTIDVDSSGCYSVEVFDKVTGCSRRAVINVKFCLQAAPSGGGGESWYFGKGAKLDFQLKGTLVSNRDSLSEEGGVFANDSTLIDGVFSPVEAVGSNRVNTTGSSAMVYGPDGALKFYTDGISIYTGDDEELTDADGKPVKLNLDPTSQGLAIIPKSTCNECPHHQYYVFSVDKDTKTLNYSVVDLRYNDRKGAVVEVNVPVMYPVTERIVATPNADSTGFIIIAHEANSDKYNLISVDSLGVSDKILSQGVAQNDATSQRGYQVISPNGRFMAVGVVKDGKNFVETYEIDRETMTLMLTRTIPLEDAPPNVYGLAFGNNSDILYVTLQGDGATIPSKLYQLPLFVGDGAAVAAAKTLIDESPTDIFGALQLGPTNGAAEKYVYMAIDGARELPYIQAPDTRGGAADVGYTRVSSVDKGIKIPGVSKFGFPSVTFANQSNDGDGIQATYRGNCFEAPTVLEIQEVCSPLRNEIEWIFPDGEIKKDKQVSYTFKKVGWNKIRVRISTFTPTVASKAAEKLGNVPILSDLVKKALEKACRDTVIIDSIYIKPSPRIALADSAFICTKDNPPTFITLDPMAKGGDTFFYNWMTGLGTRIAGTTDSTSKLRILANGNYELEVSNNFKCETAKKFKIIDKCEPRIFAPTAFSPNSDGVNEDFVVYTAHLNNYSLMIYNRWGELIFESNNPDDKWNGTIKGKAMNPTVYPWIIRFQSIDFPERGMQMERGSVTVIR